MRPLAAIPFVSIFLVTALLGTPASGQQQAPNPACGANKVTYNVTRDKVLPDPLQVPPGKALVYVIEEMPSYPIVTQKVNIGMDGTWLGATESQTYISFLVDPGVHHFCAIYQGRLQSMDEEGHTLLLRLNAQAGKTYYLRYHALLLKDSPGIAFFDPVDEDEGAYLLQFVDHATSKLKK